MLPSVLNLLFILLSKSEEHELILKECILLYLYCSLNFFIKTSLIYLLTFKIELLALVGDLFVFITFSLKNNKSSEIEI